MQQKLRLEVCHIGKHLLVLSVWYDKSHKNCTLKNRGRGGNAQPKAHIGKQDVLDTSLSLVHR